MSTIQIKSNLSIDELIGNLSKLDTPTLNYLISSLRKVQVTREQFDSLAMSEEVFWSFIGKIDWQQEVATQQIKPLVDALANVSIATIYQFSERLAFLLHQIDGPDFANPLEKSALGFSADTFLYTRCLVVAKGQSFYNTVLNNPSNIPTEMDFEVLLSVAAKAYLQKTGKSYCYIPTINYESFFNQDLWKEKAINF